MPTSNENSNPPNKDNLLIKYKAKSLKVYGSPEWLANSKKKYRIVYDRMETTFVYFEFSFYNKLFDEEDWKTNIVVRAFDLKNPDSPKQITEFKYDRTISKEENTVFVRDGWGLEEPGGFWSKGTYYWEAWIEGKSVLKQYFYIEDFGKVTMDNNPYFKILSVKFFEGTGTSVPANERRYFKKFKDKETRYLWVEMEIEKKHPENFWYGELFFNFYNDSRQLKGNVIEFRSFSNSTNNPKEVIDIGWGHEQAGSWFQDKYTVEIVFMDQLQATVPFEVTSEFELGENPLILSKTENVFQPVQDMKILSKEEILSKIDGMIGLENIKKNLKEYVSYLNFLKLRAEKGFNDTRRLDLHSVFTGNPGTGKTTVAKLLGDIYKNLGILSKGHVFEADRAELIAQYIGQTAPKVKTAIEKARGGILFIDEAYSLARSEKDTTDFGREAIEIIIKEMSDGPGDLAIIMAGYPNEMETFLNSNPGIKSRLNFIYDFPDYLPQELIQIADYAAKKRALTFTADAREFLHKQLTEAYRNRDKSFGNARYINSLVDEAKMHLGIRIMNHTNPSSFSKEEISTVKLKDVKIIFEEKDGELPDIGIDEELLRESMNELNSLIGMSEIKNDINELVKLARFYKEMKKDVLNSFSLHSVFTGNPGTGKTTVARIISKIYKALGFLERGHLVECDREALIAGFIGQTAIKTAEKINQAIGGVLFIDEAYALTMFGGGSNDFGREAIEVILKRMEDKQGKFAVIVAGYTQEMEEFLNSNPGLKSRFDRVLFFEDYEPEDLLKIAVKMLHDQKIEPDQISLDHLKKYFEFIYKNRDRFFGNARTIRKIITECIKNQNLRLASIPANQRTKEMLNALTFDDVNDFQSSKDHLVGKGQKKMGFILDN